MAGTERPPDQRMDTLYGCNCEKCGQLATSLLYYDSYIYTHFNRNADSYAHTHTHSEFYRKTNANVRIHDGTASTNDVHFALFNHSTCSYSNEIAK